MNLIIELGLRGSLLFLLIAGLDRFCGRLIGASGRRGWWVMVALSFMLPVHVALFPAPPLREMVWRGAAEVPLIARVATSERSHSTAPSAIDGLALVRWIWLAGAASYLALVVVRTIRAQRRWSGLRLSTDAALLGLLEDCKREAGVTAPIGLVVSSDVSALAILGWLRPRILVPVDLPSQLTRQQLRAVLLHELAHFRYADVPTTWLFTFAKAIHWFNPCAHLATLSWIRFREEAADEAALLWMGESTGQNYGEILLRVISPAASANPFGALGIGESFHHLKKRLMIIHHYTPKSPRWLLAGTVTFMLAGIACFQISRAADVPAVVPPNEAIGVSPNVEVHLSAASLASVVGRYDYVQAIMAVTREDDRVYAQLPGQPRYQIFPKSELVFFWKVVDAQVAFIKNNRGAVIQAMHHQAGSTLIAQKLPEVPVAQIDPASFDSYVGSYTHEGPDATMTISREGDHFFVQLTGQPKLVILPKSESEFFLRDVNAQLTFVKNAKGKGVKVINHQRGQNFEFSRPD